MAVNKKLAKERIIKLFEQAEIEKKYADSYVELARKIAMKAQISIPKSYKRKYCHNCYKFLIPGENSRQRTYAGSLVITCFSCKHISRIPLKPKN